VFFKLRNWIPLAAVLLLLGVLAFSLAPFLNQQYLKIKSQQLSRAVVHKATPDYTIVFVGDSLTEYLGNFDELQAYLTEYFPQKSFLLLNYGFGSTNILSVKDRLEKESSHSGRIFQPINQIPFDLIIIESFGYNPLSNLMLEKGLAKQNETLDQIVTSITQTHPKSSLVFMSTIAPNRDFYGKGSVNLTPDDRVRWANERHIYLKNHLQYAKSHGIPVIDIYDKSLKNGDGDLDYIRKEDYIHPSPTGVYLISNEIAEFIGKNKLLPTK
jgi:lysophospholipase L1-like esterase